MTLRSTPVAKFADKSGFLPDLLLYICPDTRLPRFSEEEWQSNTWLDNDGRISAVGLLRETLCALRLTNIGVFCHEFGSVSVVASPQNDLISDDLLQDAFFRSVVPLIVQARYAEVLHASAVSDAQGVIAFTGRSGTGKSSTAYALAQRGFDHWADDAVVAAEVNGHLRSISIPCPVRLRSDVNTLFSAGHDKMQTSPASSWSTVENRYGTLRAVVQLHPDTSGELRSPVASRLAPTDAMLMLLENAYCFSLTDATVKRKMTATYAKLAQSVPIVSFRYSQDLDQFDNTIDVLTAILPSIESIR